MAKITVHEKATLLRDVVYGANDGIITTFAIVAGSQGASLTSEIVIILGFANLLADGLSMASGNYLGIKSEVDYQKTKGDNDFHEHSPSRHGLTTFISFTSAGLLPLLPFIVGLDNKFLFSTLMVGVSLFVIGSLRSIYTKRPWVKGGFEMFLIGGFAALVAYGVGFFIDHYVI